MTQIDLTSQETLSLVRELMSSLREYSRRMDELKWVIREVLKGDSKSTIVRDRLKRMMNTKFCLIFSIHDASASLIKALGRETPDRAKEIEKIFGVKDLHQRLKRL